MPKKPNIVFILVDKVSMPEPSCFGRAIRLAKRVVRETVNTYSLGQLSQQA
jgi:hypothetical protein